MTFDEYQQKSRKTAAYPDQGSNFVYPTLGLAGEAGEVSNKISKIFRDDNSQLTDSRREEVDRELGDVLWYLAQLATELRLSLDHIASQNIERLYSRLERGTIHESGDNR
ncbi:MAG: nucleoside triphosphate pyrophosphohydrolase family protein [Patescibacteria group bacterium]